MTAVTIDAPTDGRDATDIILAQIANAPDCATIRFPIGRSGGSYRVDKRLEVRNRRDLVIEGPSPDDPVLLWTDKTGQDVGILNQNGNSARQHFPIVDCNNIHVRNVTIKGPNTYRDATTGLTTMKLAHEAEHAFTLNRCSDCTITDCNVDSVYGDGVWLHAASGFKTRRCAVTNLNVDACGRHGAGIFNVDGVVLDGMTLVHGGYGGVDMEPNGPGENTLNVEIRDCSIECRLVGINAMAANEVSGIWIHHNTFIKTKTSPLVATGRRDGGRCRDWLVEDNRSTFKISPARGINFQRIDNAVARRNNLLLGNVSTTTAGVDMDTCGTIPASWPFAPGSAGLLEVTQNDFNGAGIDLRTANMTAPVTVFGNRYANAA